MLTECFPSFCWLVHAFLTIEQANSAKLARNRKKLRPYPDCWCLERAGKGGIASSLLNGIVRVLAGDWLLAILQVLS